MTLFAHNQILPVLLITGVSVFAMIWVTDTSLHRNSGALLRQLSITPDQHTVKREKTGCYKHLRRARTAGSDYWWQRYKSCIAAN